MDDGQFQARFERLSRDLLELGRELIPRSPTASEQWLANPDSVEEHKPEWHQWGIVTHSRLFTKFLVTHIPEAFRQVDPAIAATLAKREQMKIDGMSRWQLMQIAGL